MSTKSLLSPRTFYVERVWKRNVRFIHLTLTLEKRGISNVDDISVDSTWSKHQGLGNP